MLLAATSCAAPKKQQMPVFRPMPAAMKPPPDRNSGKLAGAWKHGTCETDGRKLVYTYNTDRGVERKAARRPLAGYRGKAIAIRCSEDDTMILWRTKLELTVGADGTYLDQTRRTDIILKRPAIGGLLMAGQRALVVHPNLDITFYDIGGASTFRVFSLLNKGEAPATATTVAASKNGTAYVLRFPELSRTYRVAEVKGGNISVTMEGTGTKK